MSMPAGLLSSLLASTVMQDGGDYFVRLHSQQLARAAGAAAQAAAGRETARKIEEAMRDKIISAAGAIPLGRRWITDVGLRITRTPAKYGFETVPDRGTIAKAHAWLVRNSGKPEPATAPQRTTAVDTASSST